MKILVIGDDLTGCNAAGALFAQAGFSTLSVLGDVQNSTLEAQAEVLVINTNSRLLDSEVAQAKVKNAVQGLKTDPIISKRIDSTFRGNIGAEIQGIKSFLTARYPGKIFRFLVVPAFPDAGRTTRKGIHYVHNIPISESNVNTDEKQKLESSNISEILKPQTFLSINTIEMETIKSGFESISNELQSSNEEIVVCDAESNEHIVEIAKAAAHIESKQAVHWVSVDPGPFSVALMNERNIIPNSERPTILSFVASHTDATSEQIEFSKENIGAFWLKVDSENMNPEEVIARVQRAKASGTHYLGIDFSQSNFANLSTEPITVFSRALIEAIKPAAVYASGGETAAAVLLGIEADAFTIDFEILPLAVSGRVLGGPFAGLSFATKGGLIGDKDATVQCLKHLMQLSSFRKSTNTQRKGGTP